MVINSLRVVGRGQPSSIGTGPARADSLAAALGRLARDLDQHDDPETLLDAIVQGAVALVPGATEGSIGLLAGRHIRLHAPIGDLPSLVDNLQLDVQEGPCLDSIRDQRTVRTGDLTAEDRWPRFAPRASVLGAASILSLLLSARGETLGALNLFSRRPNAFTDESELVGQLYAGHAAIAFAGLRKQAQLNESVRSRDLIGQAKGILMERYTIDGERAFQILIRVSQNTNRKLHDIAEELVRTRTLAGRQGLPPPDRRT